MRKKEVKKKIRRIEFRCTEDEFSTIKQKAIEAGYIRTSDFIRDRTIFDSNIVLDATGFVESLVTWNKEAIHFGNNINQIARAVSADIKGKGYIQDSNDKAILDCMEKYMAEKMRLEDKLSKLLRHASRKKRR